MFLHSFRSRSLMTCRTRVLLSMLALGGGALLAGTGLSGQAQADPPAKCAGTSPGQPESYEGPDDTLVYEGDDARTKIGWCRIDPSTPEGKEEMKEVIKMEKEKFEYTVKWRDGRRRLLIVSMEAQPDPASGAIVMRQGPLVYDAEIETQAQRDKVPAEHRKTLTQLWNYARHACWPEVETPQQERILMKAADELARARLAELAEESRQKKR